MEVRAGGFQGDVLWLTSGYPWSGDEVQLSFHRTVVQALASSGISIRVISPIPAAPWPLPLLNRRWARYAATPRSYRDAGIPVDRPRFVAVPSLPKWSRPESGIARAVLHALRRADRIALVHSHFAFPIAPAGKIVADRLGVPHVVTVHGSDINTWPASHRHQLAAVVETLRSADALIAVSAALAERTKALCGRRPEVIYAGINIRVFTAGLPDRAEARRILGLESDRFFALFVGDLIRQKGAFRLADAVLLAGDAVSCLIAGEGPGLGYRADVAGGRIRYLGVKSSPDVALLMRAADALVLPSESEGLGQVLVEAGAVGTFAIASPIGGIPEVIGDGRGLLLEDLSPASIASALEATAARPGDTAGSVAALQEYVGAHFDADKNSCRLVAVYERVLSRRNVA